MTTDEKTFKENLVLIISKAGVHRDPLLKAMRQEGMQASFVSDINSVADIINDMRPGTLLHDWAAVDPSQASSFQQRMGKSSEYAGLCRIIYTETITPQLTALAADTGVRRVVTYATSLSALAVEIKMALAGTKNLSELQQLIAKVKTSGGYDQDEIDTSIEKAYQHYAHDPAVKLEFGNLSMRRNDLSQARIIASELVEAQPQNVRAMNLLARIMMKEGRMEEAIATLEKANTLSPFSTERLVMLGDAFFKVGDNTKASTYYQQALTIDPDSKEAQKGQGKLKLREGDINGALDLLRGSASEDEAASFFNNAAVHAARHGDYRQAYRLYQAATQALRTNRYKPVIFFNIAMSLEHLGEIEEAYKHVKRALKYDPNFDKALRQKNRLERLLEAPIMTETSSHKKTSRDR